MIGCIYGILYIIYYGMAIARIAIISTVYLVMNMFYYNNTVTVMAEHFGYYYRKLCMLK